MSRPMREPTWRPPVRAWSLMMTLVAAVATADGATPLTEALILPPAGRSGRSPLHTDAVEARIVAGPWETPVEGGTVTHPDGSTLTWSRLSANEDGWFGGEEFRRGYAAVHVEREEGGVALLEDTFFDLAADGAARLRDLARVLAREEPGRETEFARRLATAAIDGDVDTRLSILGVLSLFARWGIPWPILQPALADTDADIRDAASEVLFELEIDDCGYEPDASEAERRDAINTIESGLRGEGRL